MTGAALLAGAAGAAGVLGAWEALAAVERTRVAAALARALEPLGRAAREGREPTGPEQRRLAVLVAAVLLAAGWLAGGPAPAVAAAVCGPLLAVLVVRARRRRYAAELSRGAAGAARALADALGAGHSVPGAIVAVAPLAPGPVGHELRAAADALALGEPTEAVLERLRRRAGCRPWDTMVAGILLQRDAGGDLGALLRGLAGSLESAARLERDARVATAQARFTARLVVGLPVGAALVAELGSPGFLGSLLSAPASAGLVALAAGLQAVAALCVHRLARPEAMAR